jgi:hypothetical protein
MTSEDSAGLIQPVFERYFWLAAIRGRGWLADDRGLLAAGGRATLL